MLRILVAPRPRSRGRPRGTGVSRKLPSRCSKGALMRTSATSASSGLSTRRHVGGKSSRSTLRRRCAAASQRQRGAVVLEQHDRARAAPRRPRAGSRRCPTTCAGRLRVDVRVVEQPEPELVAEQPPHRHVDPRLRRRAPQRTSSTMTSGHALAAELVDAGVEDLLRPARGARGASTPQARAGKSSSPTIVVGQQPPVGADDAVEPVRSRSSPVMTLRLKPKPTSSYSVPTGMP